MITPLPFSSFAQSAACLSDRHLGRARHDTAELIKINQHELAVWPGRLTIPSLIWEGYTPMLARYLNLLIDEWEERGYVSTVIHRVNIPRMVVNPWWLLDTPVAEQLTASHRSNLLRQDPQHYGQFGWEESHDLPYYWPTKKD